MRRHALPALAALAVLITGPPRKSFELTHLPKEILAAVLAAALVWSVQRLDRLDRALLAVAVTSMLSALLAVSPAFSWRPTLLTLVAVAVAIGAREQKDRSLWLRWMGAAIAVLAAGGVIEGLGWARWSLEGRAPASLLGQRNTLAHVLVLGSPVVWTLALAASRRWERFIWLAVAALIAAVVVMTRSRAAWLAAPVVLITFGALSKRAAVIGPVAAGIAAGLLSPIGLVWRSTTPYLDSARRLFQSEAGSGAGRLEQWSHTLALFPTAPVLGVGPGNWCVANAGCDPSVSNRFVTSDWVALLVERGALGAVAVAVAVSSMVVLWRRSDQLPVVAAVIAGAAVTGALDAVTQLPAALVLCAVVCFGGLERTSGAAVTPRPVSMFFAIGALACASAFASRWVSSGQTTTFDDLELAVRLDPTDALTRAELLRSDVSAGRCEEGSPHAEVLKRQLPRESALDAFHSVCDQR